MGRSGWLKADRLTKNGNIYKGCAIKFLIPKEFGGGFIEDIYQGDGYLGTRLHLGENGVEEKGGPRYDIYELIALWNKDSIHQYNYKMVPLTCVLDWNGKNSGVDIPIMKEIDKSTEMNRLIGMNIVSSDFKIKMLKYPPKMVSCENNKTYEECEDISLKDFIRGGVPKTWEEIDSHKKALIEINEYGINSEINRLVDEMRKDIMIYAHQMDSEHVENFLKTYAEIQNTKIRYLLSK